MFEKKITEILKSVFEPYIDGLNPNNLSLANLLSGKLVLNNLHVKTSVIDFLELPFHLTFGLLGTVSIKVHIPILSLSKKNLAVEISDVIFLLTTKPESQWDAEAHRDEYIASKIAILASEALQLVVKEIEGSGFVWNTALSFLETLEINIHNIHVRIEDYTTNPNVSYAIGCVIKRAFFHTNVRPTSGEDGSKSVSNILLPFQSLFKSENGKKSPSITHRSIDLEGFGLYIDQLDPLGPVFMKYNGQDEWPGDRQDAMNAQNDRNSEDGAQDGEGSLKRNASEEFSNDELAFLDAIGSHPGGSDQYKSGVSYQSICVVKTEPPRKRVFMRKPVYRRNFASKNRRLKFNKYARPRYKSVPRHLDHADKRPNAIDKTNLLYTLSFSHILNYLVRGSHFKNCDNHVSSFNVWDRSNYSILYKNDMYIKGNKDPYTTLLLSKKRRTRAKDARSKESDSSFNIPSGSNSEYQFSTGNWRLPGFLSFKRRKSTPSGPLFGKYSDTNSKDVLGYKVSPGISWRSLLSTFCTIQRPNVSQNNASLEIINRSQTRDRERRSTTMSANAECDTKSNDIWDRYSDVNLNQLSISSPSNVNTEIQTPSNTHTELARLGDVRYASNEYLLSYDVNWHVRNKGEKNEDGATAPPEEEETANVKPESVHTEKIENLRIKESWTRLTFVTHDESTELLEFFLKTLEETDHNYFLNPKDFKGVASFYFCSYPILPSQILKSCWSAWGSKHGRARSTSFQNEYLPRCSIFLVLEDIDITISKEQVDCIYNVFTENIYKYWYWAYGVISTFENPRATPEDEKLYMEYWPQYLLLENNADKDELKEFVLDFEILHSIQTIRVLRNRASVSLSELIRNFGRGLSFCSMGSDFNSCVADTLFTNICSSYEDREIDVNGLSMDNTSKVQDRLKFVGGIYELASKHASSTGILMSLRKICNQQVFTVDIVIDIFLLNSRLILTNKMETFKNISNIMGYILSVNGLHIFYQDTIGRDGSQFIEIEALPFSVLSLDFCASPSSELFSTMGCACKLLSGPPSILVACGNVPQLTPTKAERSAKKDLLNMLKREIKVTVVNNSLFFSGCETDAIVSITDSVLYFSIEYSHFYTPAISDVRVRFNLNSELFIHFPVLDEINNIFRMQKYNMQKHLTLDAVRVYSDKKKEYHLNECRFDNLREVYQLIDLGYEYVKDVVQGSIPFLNYDFLIESNHQILALVELNLKDTTFPYFLSIDNFSIRSEMAPKGSYNARDLHYVRVINPRIFSCNDFSSILSPKKSNASKGPRRVYMGSNLSIPFSAYISTLSKTSARTNYDDLIKRLDREFEILKFGVCNEFSMKITSARSGQMFLNPENEEPGLIVESSLGEIYINLRDIDIAALVCTYNSYLEYYDRYMQSMALFNKQGKVVKGDVSNSFIHEASFGGPLDATFKNDTPEITFKNDLPEPTFKNQSTSLGDADMKNLHGSPSNLGALASIKWIKLQSKTFHSSSSTSRYIRYEFDMDYLCLNFQRVVDFDCPKKLNTRGPGAHQLAGNKLEDFVGMLNTKGGITPSGVELEEETNKTGHVGKYSRTFYDLNNDRVAGLNGPGQLHLAKLDSLLKLYGITTPLCSLKVTGFGLKLGMHNDRIKRLCGFLGCVEVEDQSNSVPLYASTLFCGGQSTPLWRWLKVRREIKIAKKNHGSFFSAKNKHISVECKLNHVDPKTGNVEPNCRIAQSYKLVEEHMQTVMNYDVPFLQQEDTLSSQQGLAQEINSLFITVSAAFTSEQEQNFLVYISSSVLNIVWEVVDEILHFARRISEYSSEMPKYIVEPIKPAARQTFSPSGISTINFSMHVSKSKINILSESSWFGYPNLVKYMWYKILRDYSGIVDKPAQNSRRSSIGGDPMDQSRNLFNKFVMSSMDFPVSSGHGKMTSTDSGRNMGSSMRWSLVRLILNDRNKKAYIPFPISLCLSGEGSIYFHYTHSQDLFHPNWESHYSRMKRDESERKPPSSWWKRYTPCIFQVKVEGRNISSTLGRHGSGIILTPCGYFQDSLDELLLSDSKGDASEGKGGSSNSKMGTSDSKSGTRDGYRHSRMDFNKYMRLHHLQDSKLYGLLEISKHTLYDVYDSKVSEIIKPFRFTASTVVCLYDTSSQVWYNVAVPQSIASSLDVEPVDLAMNCVDLLSLMDTLMIAFECIEGWSDQVAPIHVPQSMSELGDDIYLTLDEVMPVKGDLRETDEFHSCSSYESDWTSVMSNEDAIEVIGQGFSALEKRNKKRYGIELFLLRLLSSFSLGLRLNVELVNIEISSNIDADIRHVFVLSLEDTKAKFWVNGMSGVENAEDAWINDVDGAWTNDGADPDGPWINDANRVWINEGANGVGEAGEVDGVWINDDFDFYMLDLCLSGIGGLLPLANLSNYELYRNSSSYELFSDDQSQRISDDPKYLDNLENNITRQQPRFEHLMQFECQTLITFDISKDSSKEMTLESVKVLFSGNKASLFSKTFANINVSWINVNITLNVAECYFGFLRYMVAMSRLRSIILDGANADYISMQPATLSNIYQDVKTTMVPFNLLSEQFKHHFINTVYFGIFSSENVQECFEFRYFNNLFSKRGSLDIYKVLLEMNKTLLDSKVINMGNIDLFNMKPRVMESSLEPNSYLYNNLGQPILICTEKSAPDGQLKWKTILNGESCILSSGHYGVILPFIIRLQISNCVYDIPSSSLEISQNTETLFKLEIAKGIFKRRFMPNGMPNSGKSVFRLHKKMSHGKQSMHSSTDDGKGGSTHEGSKFAYMMVRIVERFGVQTVATSTRSALNIHLSSLLFVSNKSRENVVIFPCSYHDTRSRVIQYSSLVSLNLPIPPAFLPVSSKNLVTLRGSTMKDVSHVSMKDGVGHVFRQIANISESKAVRKLAPVHILDPFNRQYENKLQYIPLNGNFFHPTKVPIPLSWTIDHFSICISLEEDFPFYAKKLELASRSVFNKISSSRIDILSSAKFDIPSSRQEAPSSRNFGGDIDMYREICFNGDVLFSSESAQYLYDSFESQRLKTPIPGYTPQVNLGRDVVDEPGVDSGEFIDLDDCLNTEKSERSSVYAQSLKFSNFPASRRFLESSLNHSMSEPDRGDHSLSRNDSFNTKAVLSKSGFIISNYLSGKKKVETGRLGHENFGGLPSVTLSSTLIEFSSTPRLNISLNPLKYVVRQYEIMLESCQVIENLMPHDIHFITPAIFDFFKANDGRPTERVDVRPAEMNAHPMEHNGLVDDVGVDKSATIHSGRNILDAPESQVLVIKAGGNTHLTRAIHRGRFILKDMISKEMDFKISKETCTNLAFEVMQPGFMASASHYIGEKREPDEMRTLPRRIIVMVDVSKKSSQPVKDKSGYYRRYIESSQISCTIFVYKWVINWLDYPVVLCRSDGRFQQTIGAKSCTVASQDLTSTQLQLAIRKSNLKQIPNFDNYRKNDRRWFSRHTGNHLISTKFLVPDLTFATCSIKNIEKYPNLHYLVSTCMAPLPFYRTGIIEILPQITLINEFETLLWIRETMSGKGNVIKFKRGVVWHKLDSGTTVEFHPQTKGEPLVKITGANPKDVGSPTERNSAWSCPIALKPSTLVQFRFPMFSTLDGQVGNIGSEYKPTGQNITYGICEVEIQMHRGAKLVRFSRPTTPEWVILNSTGLGLWIEQYGTTHGEVIPFGKLPLEQMNGTLPNGQTNLYAGELVSSHLYTGGGNYATSQNYGGGQNNAGRGRFLAAPIQVPSRQYFAANGVPFAWYDPFKDQKLVCRFHTVQRLALADFLSTGRLLRYTNVRRTHRSKEKSQLSGLFTLGRLTSYGQRKKRMGVKVKGYLLIDLSKVESVSYTTVCQIRLGKVKFNVRVQAQSLVMFGQRTLYFTATKMSQKTFSFKYLKATNILQLYKQLRRQPTPRHRLSGYNYSAEPLRRQSLVNPEYVLHVNVSGFGACLCSYLPDELVYLSLTSIKFETSLENMENKHKLSIGWIQSDVHDATTCFPTMIRPIVNYSIFNKRMEKPRYIEKLAFDASCNGNELTRGSGAHLSSIKRMKMSKAQPILVVVFNTRSNVNLKEVTEFTLDLEPISINMDTRIVSTILFLLDDYISIFGFSDRTSEYFATPAIGIFSNAEGKFDNFDTTEYPLHEIAKCRYSDAGSSGTKYNISQLRIGKLAVIINIRRSGTLMISDVPPQSPVIRYLVYIVRRTPHISDAHITLAKESLLKLCCTPYVLISHFATRYISQAVQQIYKVLWAVDLIGNPKMVVNHWVSGLYNSLCDVREALRYLHLPPVAFFLILKGISHFGIALFSGMVDAFYRFTGSWYLLLNTMACNSDRYAVLLMQEVFTRTHGQPSNVVEGFLFGWISVGRNLYISWGNFALKPIHAVGKFVHSIKEDRGTRDVLSSGVNILGSLVSATSSLVFGTFSSILSGISLAMHGLLNQIHAVPMLSAIRPKRSCHSIKIQSPTRYNFLESWSMESFKKMDQINDVLLILPLDRRNLFDPTYISTSHWSILEGDISPLILSQSFGKFKNMFWIDCTRMGYIENERIRWKTNNRDVVAVEVLRIAMDDSDQNGSVWNDGMVDRMNDPQNGHYDHSFCTHSAHNDHYGRTHSSIGTMSVSVTPKVAKRYFSRAQYYIRLIHIGAESNPLSLRERKRIPRIVQAKLMDQGTFNITQTHAEDAQVAHGEVVMARMESKAQPSLKNSIRQGKKVAELVRMPNVETAMLYFTLLVSILREAAF